MKHTIASPQKGKLAAKAVALLGLILLTGCGSSGTTAPVSKVPGRGSTLPNGGCVSIHAPIPFTGNSVYVDSYSLVGGQLPPNDHWMQKKEGNVVIGGTPITAPGMGVGSLALGGYGFDGTVMMNVTPIQNQQQQNPMSQHFSWGNWGTWWNGWNSGMRANIQGTLNLSPAVQQEILYYLGGYQQQWNQWWTPTLGGGLPQQQPQTTTQACASSISFNMGYAGGMPYGKIYLYLNRTQHGIVLVF